MPESLRPCPVCLSTSSEKIYHLDFPVPEDFALGPHQNVLACDSCGMVYSDSVKSQDDYNRYYSSLKKYTEEAHLHTCAGSRFLKTAQQIESFSDNRRSLCDVGCGGGGLLHALYARGFRKLSGTDPSSLAPETIRGHFQHLRMSLMEAPKISNHFDVVTAIGVLEHLRDVRLGLRTIKSMIEEDGYFYAEVPDATKYCETVLSPFQDFNLEHINHFSSQTLSQLLEREGFTIKSTMFFTQPESEIYQMPVIAIVAQKKKIRFQISKDHDLRKRIEVYVEKSQALLNAIDTYLMRELTPYESVIIWGVGQLSLKLIQLRSLREKKIEVLIDKCSGMNSLLGNTIRKPFVPANENTPILIASVLHASSIRNDIHKMGIKNPIIEITRLKPQE